MEEVVLVIHLFLALTIIGLVLLQRSEGGGLGIGGGGLGGLATPQGAANLLTRMTAVCAGLFFCTSLLLGILAGAETRGRVSLVEALKDQPAAEQSGTSAAQTPEASESEKTPKSSEPSVPIAR